MAPVDPDLAKRLAVHYAPECRFDSREQHFPCSLEFLAASSSLRRKTWFQEKPEGDTVQQKDKTWVVDVEVIPHGQVNDPRAACASQYPLAEGAIKAENRLEPIPESWPGQPITELESGGVPCYFSVVPASCCVFDDDLDQCINNTCDDVYEITYYMVYTYNGNIFSPWNLCTPCEVDTHTGDIEQVVIYCKDPEKLQEGDDGFVACFQNRHAGEGRFCETPEHVVQDKGPHTVVFPALESHATYSTPSWTLRIFGFANDLHNGKGPKWQTWKNLVAINKEKGEPVWINFDGRFGGVEGLATRKNLGRPGFGSSNCRYPSFLPLPLFAQKVENRKTQIPRKLVDAVKAK